MEIWKEIPGMTGYEVSNRGNARSLERVIIQKSRAGALYERVFPAKALSPRSCGNTPYLYINPSVSGKRGNLAVHVAVLTAFVGPRPSAKHEGCHKDDNPLNNALPNLYWGTRRENEDDKRKNGGVLSGDNIYNATLSNAVVAAIKSGEVSLDKYGMVAKAALVFGVSRSVIGSIKKGYRWQSLDYRAYVKTPEFAQALAVLKQISQ